MAIPFKIKFCSIALIFISICGSIAFSQSTQPPHPSELSVNYSQIPEGDWITPASNEFVLTPSDSAIYTDLPSHWVHLNPDHFAKDAAFDIEASLNPADLDGGSIDILFNYVDSSNFAFVRFSSIANEGGIYRVVGGNRSQWVPSPSIDLVNDEYNEITFRHFNGQLQVTLNNQGWISLPFSKPNSPTGWGFGTNGAAATFKNFKLRPDQFVDSAYEADFQLRGDMIIDQISDSYFPPQFSDRGKYSFPKAIARFEKYGLSDTQANDYIAEYRTSYNLFHFPFVGLARILSKYGEAPKASEHMDYLLNKVINNSGGYQYNAFYSEGTENHVGMSRTSGYLFTQLALALDGFDTTKAEPYHDLMEDWIHRWSKRIFATGTGEWDSNVYTAFNFIGWLNLYDFAEDPTVKSMAKAVLDYYATVVALKHTQGVHSGAESRGTPSVGTRPISSTEYFGWLWFGDSNDSISFSGNDYIQTIHGITSSYRPPRIAIEIARKETMAPASYHLLKPDYLLTEAGESHENYYIDDAFTVGTVQTPYGGWTNTAYGVINWKLIAKNDEGSPSIFWGNGGMKSSSHGRGRNPYDQFFQYENTVFQLTRVPSNAFSIQSSIDTLASQWRSDFSRDFRARWGFFHESNPVKDDAKGNLSNANNSYFHFPFNSLIENDGDVFFFEHGEAYVVARSLSGSTVTINTRSLMDSAPTDSIAGFVVEAFAKADFTDFENFKTNYLTQTNLDLLSNDPLGVQYTNFNGEIIKITYSTSGSWNEMAYDWSYGVTEKRYFFQTEDWIQPTWPTGEGHGRIAQVEIDGAPIDSFANTALIDGPNIYQNNSILTLSEPGNGFYEVDYSGEVPIFRTSHDVTTVPYAAEPLEGGTIEPNSSETFTLFPDLEQKIFAYPNEGFEFSHWEGDLTGSDNPISFSLPVPTNLTAVFTAGGTQASITEVVVPSIAGSIVRYPIAETLPSTTPIELNIVVNPGYQFDSWSPLNANTPKAVFTLEQDITIQANLSEIETFYDNHPDLQKPGWIDHENLGLIYIGSTAWDYHNELEWFIPVGSDDPFLWIYSTKLGFIGIAPDAYPIVYVFTEDAGNWMELGR